MLHGKLLRLTQQALHGNTNNSNGNTNANGKGGGSGKNSSKNGSVGGGGSGGAGSVYNLIASDATRFDNVSPMMHLGYIAIPSSVVVVVLLAQALGWASALAGSSTMFAFIVIQVHFGKEFGRRRGITAKVSGCWL
jgi:hypothetical protein